MRAAILTALSFAFTLVPGAAAQVPPATVSVDLYFVHDPTILPETGRGSVGIEAKVSAAGFTCLWQSRVQFSINFAEEFSKWAGASVEPSALALSLAIGEPGPNSYKQQKLDGARLDLAWDVESAPSVGAQQAYRIVATNLRLDSDGACWPVPMLRAHPSEALVVRLPDRSAIDPVRPEEPMECGVVESPIVFEERRPEDSLATIAAPPVSVAFLAGLAALLVARRRMVNP